MICIKITDLKITKINEDGTFTPHPIVESEYYKSLPFNNNIFNDYEEKLSKYYYKDKPNPNITYFDFIKLWSDIKNNGFDMSKGCILINKNNVVLDGQHRLSILYDLYGENLWIEFIDGKSTKILVSHGGN